MSDRRNISGRLRQLLFLRIINQIRRTGGCERNAAAGHLCMILFIVTAAGENADDYFMQMEPTEKTTLFFPGGASDFKS